MLILPSIYSDPVEISSPEEGSWYQVMDWPDGSVTPGVWDYRGKADEILGRLDYGGISVVEVGPASGFLTKEMGRRGANVTCIDMPLDKAWHAVPREDIDLDEFGERHIEVQRRLRKAWWLTQKRWETHARIAHIGSDRVREVGPHDRALVSCVLQHLRDPISFLYEVSSLVKEVVVTEPVVPRVERIKGGGAMFAPAPTNDITGTWWLLSSALVVQVLATSGFERVDHYTNSYDRTDVVGTTKKDFYTSVFRRSPSMTKRAARIKPSAVAP